MMNINPTQAIRNVWLVELFENNADGLTLQEIIDEYQLVTVKKSFNLEKEPETTVNIIYEVE